jgi:TyrR family helix-turn-helix protein/PAS domain S-box-containing protein
MNIKMELVFKDRIGIVADISAVIADHGINIVSMEVEQRDDHAHVFLEARKRDQAVDNERLLTVLSNIPDLIRLQYIDIMPQKERENRFRVVLDNISDGVFSIGKDGCLTTINRIARKAVGCENRPVIGRSIKEIDLPDYMILECLEGRGFSRIKKTIVKENDRYQYFATGRPIIDADGRIIGAVEIAKDMQEIKRLAQSLSDQEAVSFGDIIGRHPTIMAAIAFAQRIAGSDSIVSIRGASGTGKELFARAIHMASGRTGPFVPLNCAALPEQLLESELFGYVGGSFTGGRREGRPGLFEYAAGGSVFLDEIGEMPLASQAKILRVIQDKRVRRIGGSKEIPINTRIITATHRPLEQLVENKLFRQDLYYRVNVLPIHIPPLGERTEDISRLADHFLFQLASKLNKPLQSLSPDAVDKLCRHSWPGNVRELKNVIERAAILCEGDVIEAASIVFSHDLVCAGPAAVVAQTSGPAARPFNLKAVMAEHERGLISQAMLHYRSKREAARALGISHTALLNKLKKYLL